MTPAKDSKPSGAMEQQSPKKAQKRKTDSPSRLEESPAMVIIKKRKHSAGPPDPQTSGSVAGNTRKRPATAVAVCESCPSVVKRRKIPSPPQYEELTAVTEKCMHSNDRAAGDTSVTTSSCNKKRSASESSPRSAKRRKIPSQSPNEQTAAVIMKRENTTQEAAGENSVTVSKYNKKRSASESSPRSEKRRKIHDTPSTSKASQPFSVDQNTKTKEAKERRAKPKELIRKKLDTARLLHQRGVRLFKKSEVRDITSLGTKLLGSGSYGSCHLAVDPNTRQPLVIKKFPCDGLDDLATEATNLHALRLPGVQRLVGVCVSTRQMITGFAGTTLPKYFLTRPSFADAISVFLQISSTLQQMLDKGFSHNDIKGDNICVQVDSNAPKATIIDLGLAQRVGTTELYEYTSDTESYSWLAPELLLHTHPCGEASDVYSVAQLLEEELLSGNTRVRRHHMAALTRWILRAQKLNPRKRPRLAALIDLLQQLHQEATWDTKE